jgi:hypothetical protein
MNADQKSILEEGHRNAHENVGNGPSRFLTKVAGKRTASPQIDGTDQRKDKAVGPVSDSTECSAASSRLGFELRRTEIWLREWDDLIYKIFLLRYLYHSAVACYLAY